MVENKINDFECSLRCDKTEVFFVITGFSVVSLPLLLELNVKRLTACKQGDANQMFKKIQAEYYTIFQISDNFNIEMSVC